MDKRELYNRVNREGQKKEPTTWRWHDPSHPRHERYKIRFKKIVDNVKGPKVLDVGCGGGLTPSLLKDREDIKEIHGVDLQKSILEDARKYVDSAKVTFHHGFAEEVDQLFEPETFDTVVATEVIEHVSSVDDTLKAISGVLKSDGRVILSCPINNRINELHVRSITEDFFNEYVTERFDIEEFEIIEYPGRGPKGIFCVAKKKEEN